MRRLVPIAALLFVMVWAVRPMVAQIADPIPAPIAKRGLRVALKQVARDARASRP